MNLRSPMAMLCAGVVLTCLTFLHLRWGEVPMGAAEWWGALCGTGEPSSLHNTILWEVRLPRTLTAIAAGALLGWLGMLLQTWFRNPLAGPGVLGITSGGSLGVALAVLTGLTMPTWDRSVCRVFDGVGVDCGCSQTVCVPGDHVGLRVDGELRRGVGRNVVAVFCICRVVAILRLLGDGHLRQVHHVAGDLARSPRLACALWCCVEHAGWTCGPLDRTWPKPWAFLRPNFRANCSCWLALWWGGSLRCAAPWRSSVWPPHTCTSSSARRGVTAP